MGSSSSRRTSVRRSCFSSKSKVPPKRLFASLEILDLVIKGIQFAHVRFRCKTEHYTGKLGSFPRAGSVGKPEPKATGFRANREALDVFVGWCSQCLSGSKTESGAMARADDFMAFDAALADGASIVAADVFNCKDLVIDEKNSNGQSILVDV